MEKSNHSINEVGENVAILLTEFKNLSENFSEFKEDNKLFVKEINKKADTNENDIISLKTKTSNLAIFQSVFSVIIGAIATYLGAKK